MKILYRSWIILSLVALAFSVGFAFYARNVMAQGANPPTGSDAAIRAAVQAAVQKSSVGIGNAAILAFVVNTVDVGNIFYSNDGRTAVVWLVLRDQFSGDIVGREPGLAIARNPMGAMAGSASGWQISFETPNTLSNLLSTLPPELVTDDMRMRFSSAAANSLLPSQNAVQAALTGYKLPWSSALRIRITGSIGHFLDYHSCSEADCRYAYDFWNPDGGNRMFPLLASKGGIVVAFRQSCANNDHSCTNYLVLEDNSTNPTSYQLYYHMMHGSIPPNLPIGAYVQQGQFIGNVDNTGYSSDSHLHFMVFTSPTSANYFWGRSVQIKFDDVPFNNGEPRTCAESVNYPSYGTGCSAGPDGQKLTSDDDILTSQNVGTQSPTGSLDAPAAWTTLTDKTLNISGTASDALGITRIDMLANYDGTWKTVANADYANGAFSKAVDMCSAGIPDGPVSIAVRIWNLAGNWSGSLTGLRQIFKNAPCGNAQAPVPACAPSADQVALYSEPGFSGFCQKFSAGKYTASQLGPVGDNGAASIQVGANVRAVLYDSALDLTATLPTGRLETFAADDGNLTGNRIGAKTVSALWVMASGDLSDSKNYEPRLIPPVNPANTGNLKSSDSLVLNWSGGRGAALFVSQLNGPVVKSMPAANTQTWSVGSLPAGKYTWTVTACGGTSSCGTLVNTSSLDFTVDAAPLSSAGQVDAPITMDMESGSSGWTESGLWHLADLNRLQADQKTKLITKAWIFNNGANYNSPTRAGDLTSPPIHISANGAYFLHFRFFSSVEGALLVGQTVAQPFWDQRRVQISVDGGAFSDLNSVPPVAPLSDDTQNIADFWPSSPDLALGNLTAGQIVRVRYHFDAIDASYNETFGWAVDDVRVDTAGPDTSCAGLSNETPATATAVTLDGPALSGVICPKGDVDYYSFTAPAGTPVRIQIAAKSVNPANPLDSFIQLIDSNGKDVLISNDDQDKSVGDPAFHDSRIDTILPKTGTYFVRVKAWDYPGSGGPDYKYTLSVTTNTASSLIPSIRITKPVSPQQIALIPFIVEANAADPLGSGILRVDFYWHTSDWVNSSWVKFASDTNGSDGWWAIFNPTGINTVGGAFYVLATNNAGGTAGALLSDLAPDNTPPSSQMLPLPAAVNSTAVQLTWTEPAGQIDVNHYEFQYTFNNGAWTNWSVQPAGEQRSAWFVGQPGAYTFRMQAVDNAQNAEGFPGTAEASTTLNGACVHPSSESSHNSIATAIALNGVMQQLVLCQNDVTYVSFSATQGQNLVLLFPSLSGGAAVHIHLYDPTGATVLLEGGASGAGQGFFRSWKAPATGTYSIEIQAVDPALYGSDVKYGAYAGPGGIYYFPLVGR